MLRGYVAMAPASPQANSPLKTPIDQVDFPLVKGSEFTDIAAQNPAQTEWPTYRGDRWRSGSTMAAGPAKLQTQWNVKLQTTPLPDGPIVFDWRENPFVKGPVSAPTVAAGRVFVARPDAHEVIALDATTGKQLWNFTAHGRVDLPPTLYRGLALFGCHGGFVYAVKADTGQLVWELRAAPLDEPGQAIQETTGVRRGISSGNGLGLSGGHHLRLRGTVEFCPQRGCFGCRTGARAFPY